MPPNTSKPDAEEERLARRKDYKLWIWVVFAFVIISLAWAYIIYVSSVNKPQVLEVESALPTPIVGVLSC
jgi:hypothetical protein